MRDKDSLKVPFAVLLLFAILGSTFIVSTSTGVTTIATETQTESAPTVSTTTTSASSSTTTTTHNSMSIPLVGTSINPTNSSTATTGAFTSHTTAALTNIASTGPITFTGSLTNSTTSPTLTTMSSSSLTTFPQVLVHNGTLATQDQIDQFLANGTILGTINVGASTTNFTGSDAFTVESISLRGSLTIIIGAQGISGLRIVFLNISKDSFLSLQGGYLAVLLDNQTVPESASLHGVLTGSGTPAYILLGTSSGFELLLSIPHFSTHTIVIATPESNNQTTASNSSSLNSYAVGGIVVVILVFIILLAIRSQRNKRLGSPRSSR